VVPGGYAMGDYSFETPSTRLRAEVSGQEPRWAQYEYPGHFTRQQVGEQRSRVRLEALEVAARTLRGQGRVRGFISGYRFTLAEHVRGDVNGDYVLRWVSHTATREAYGNSFEAIPAATPFRPPRVTPRPVATGVQSARVVGEPGADIWTDRYGRVKVQFPWDRKGRQNDQSSCWIRVAQGQAGKGWGHFFLPHVGQEVLVTFVDGDPDRPIITGSVYNAEQRVPFELTREQTRSTLRSAPSGEGEPNEVRFEDKKGSEELYLHARRDLKLSADHDSVRVVEHDDTLVVKQGDRQVRVEKGNEVHEVQGNYTLTVHGNLTLDVKGSIQLKAAGSLSSEAGMSLTHKAGMSLTNEAGMSLTNKAGMSLTNEAGCNLTNKAGLMIQNESMSMMSRTQAFQTLLATGPLLLKGPVMTLPL
jgi:type VI secretion system secreted protein VgrG